MKPNQLAKIAAVILALAGVAALLAAGLVAIQSFTAPGLGPRQFDCGSVLFAKDPRDQSPRGAPVVRPTFRVANRNCEAERSDRTTKALTFMLVGAAPLLLLLALPALTRRSRRARSRRRKRM